MPQRFIMTALTRRFAAPSPGAVLSALLRVNVTRSVAPLHSGLFSLQP